MDSRIFDRIFSILELPLFLTWVPLSCYYHDFAMVLFSCVYLCIYLSIVYMGVCVCVC